MRPVDDFSVKRCRCGQLYDQQGWDELPFVGVSILEEDNEAIEMRNCSCGSTIAVELSISSAKERALAYQKDTPATSGAPSPSE